MQQFPLLDGSEIDRRLSLQPGTADRLAKRGKLTHLVLPDGAIRFSWPDVVESLKQFPPAQQPSEEEATNA